MTEYQVVIGVKGAFSREPNEVLDYCREQVQADTDDAAIEQAHELIQGNNPPRGTLLIRYIEVWEPKFRRVMTS